MPARFARFFLLLLALAMPLGAAAGSEYRQNFVYIAKEDVVDGNVYRAGDSVQIDGTVNGDVIVAGGTVKITGTVAGDVIAAGGRIVITGPVQGSVRVAGGDVFIDAVVGRNATIAGGNVVFGGNAAVGSELLAMGGTVEMDGRVSRDARIMGSQVSIGGMVGRHALVSAGTTLTLRPTAVINGDLEYLSPRAAETVSGATIKGQVDYKALPVRGHGRDPKAAAAWLMLMFVAKVAGLFLLGLLVLVTVPKKMEKVTREMTASFAEKLGWGVIAAVLTPFAALLLAVSIIGLPIAGALMILYLFGMLMAYVFAAFWLGETVLKHATGRHWRGVDEKWALLFGAFLLVLVKCIPVVGGLVCCILMLAAFGAWLSFEKQESKKWK